MSKEWMPKGGVKELQQTKSGQDYLKRLQKKHKMDILQPGQPGFNKRYGAKVKADRLMHERQEKKARIQQEERTERKEFDDRKASRAEYKKYY